MGPMIDMKATGQCIRSLIRQRGYTVRDVQKYLGFTYPQSIYHWFDRRNLPTVDNLYALSELLRVPMDELVVGSRADRTSSGELITFAIITDTEYGGGIGVCLRETLADDIVKLRRRVQDYAEKLGSKNLAV